MRSLLKNLFLFAVGGIAYVLIEIAYRGYSHWTMFFLGGTCFLMLGYINKFLPWETPLCLQMLIGTIVITTLEFMTGMIVNIWLNWSVWNYSNVPFNFHGQICLIASIGWYFLSSVGIVLDDYLRYFIFKEEHPRYKIF